MFVKICGLTNSKQIDFAAALGYDIIGIVLHKNSSRYVHPAKAKELAGVAKEKGITCAAVALSYAEVSSVASYFDFIQIYEKIKTGFPTIFATSEEPEKDTSYDYLLYDISKGSGHFEGFAEWVHRYRDKIILAGGLNSQNIDEIICRYKPFGIDVSSGVEKQKGIKDFHKMEDFIQKVRAIS